MWYRVVVVLTPLWHAASKNLKYIRLNTITMKISYKRHMESVIMQGSVRIFTKLKGYD
jgi:hypothetical protein